MVSTGLKDNVVIVTGANHGIGAATAIAFAAEGARYHASNVSYGASKYVITFKRVG